MESVKPNLCLDLLKCCVPEVIPLCEVTVFHQISQGHDLRGRLFFECHFFLIAPLVVTYLVLSFFLLVELAWHQVQARTMCRSRGGRLGRLGGKACVGFGGGASWGVGVGEERRDNGARRRGQTKRGIEGRGVGRNIPWSVEMDFGSCQGSDAQLPSCLV
jgi:hypothetical protein